MNQQSSRFLSILLYVVLAILWGSNFMYMKLASDHISPLQIVLVRVLFGFIPILIFASIIGVIKKDHLKHAHHFFVMSLLAASVYYFCFAKGTSLLPSGIAGAITGAIPVFSFLTAWIFLREEKLNRKGIAGIIISFAGVVLLADPFQVSVAEISREGVLYIIMGSFSVGASFIYAKKFVTPLEIHPAALVTYQLGLASILLVTITDLGTISDLSNDTKSLIGATVGLGFLGTGVVFLGYYHLIKTLGAVTASSVTYLPPIVALLIGVIFIGEPISIADFFYTGLVLSGVIMIRLGQD